MSTRTHRHLVSPLCLPVLAAEGPETHGHGPHPGELCLEGVREVLYFPDPKMTLIPKYFIRSVTVFQGARNTEKHGLQGLS